MNSSPWPHRLAVTLVGTTFPLIWVGGLVTTYDAGMSVPDWPSTYGYNLLLYPWSTWIGGPWDLFIEHGHRLLAVAVGILTITLLVVTWWREPRRWVCWLTVGCLALVIVQGMLGGARVLMDELLLARIHGITGPLFFLACVTVSAVTSEWWRAEAAASDAPAARLQRLACTTWALAFIQLLLGSHLRHLPADWSTGTFRALVVGHLAMAGALLAHAILLATRAARRVTPLAASQQTDAPGAERRVRATGSGQSQDPAESNPSHGLRAGTNDFAAPAETPTAGPLRLPAMSLLLLVTLQWLLGVATWLVKYSWPTWLPRGAHNPSFVVEAESMSQAVTVTAHVAVGSLILALTWLLVLRTSRCASRWRLALTLSPTTYTLESPA